MAENHGADDDAGDREDIGARDGAEVGTTGGMDNGTCDGADDGARVGTSEVAGDSVNVGKYHGAGDGAGDCKDVGVRDGAQVGASMASPGNAQVKASGANLTARAHRSSTTRSGSVESNAPPGQNSQGRGATTSIAVARGPEKRTRRLSPRCAKSLDVPCGTEQKAVAAVDAIGSRKIWDLSLAMHLGVL